MPVEANLLIYEQDAPNSIISLTDEHHVPVVQNSIIYEQDASKFDHLVNQRTPRACCTKFDNLRTGRSKYSIASLITDHNEYKKP